jgi:hypothetical protein
MSERPAGASALLDALARGIRGRIEAARAGEERLASFAFVEGGPPRGGTSGIRPHYFIARALAAAGDPETLVFLRGLRGGGRPLGDIAERGPARGDRAAAADWIGGLAAAGLVTRELEADHVSLTPLGEAILELVDELERRLEAVKPAGGGAGR